MSPFFALLLMDFNDGWSDDDLNQICEDKNECMNQREEKMSINDDEMLFKDRREIYKIIFSSEINL